LHGFGRFGTFPEILCLAGLHSIVPMQASAQYPQIASFLLRWSVVLVGFSITLKRPSFANRGAVFGVCQME